MGRCCPEMDPKSPADKPPVTRTVLLVALAVYLAATLFAGFGSGWNLVDDALIFCRYASNCAAGHGPVYNPGERVEAHSSPLWVALLSLGARLGMDLPYLTRALGILAGAGVVTLAALAFGVSFAPFVAFMLTLMVAGDAGLAVWGVAGLETNGFALILFALWVVLKAVLNHPGAGSRWLLGGLAGLLALTRPEGAALGAIAVLFSVVRGPAKNVPSRWVSAVPFVTVLAILFFWRMNYYGTPLPTSVSGKFLLRADSLLNGLSEVSAHLLRRWPVVVCALAAVVPFRRSSFRADAWSVSTAAACLILILTTVVAGGDWMGRDRLPGPMIGPLMMLAGCGIRRLSPAPRKSALVLLAAAAISFSWWHPDWIPRHQHVAARLGDWLRATQPADTRLGAAAAGTVPFHSGFHTTDALGISDPDIAATVPPVRAPWKPGHMRYDTRRFLAAGPDIIVWEFGSKWCLTRLAEPARDPDRRGGDYRRELLWSPEFRSSYRIMSGVPADMEALYTVFQRVGEPASGGESP